MGDAPAALHGYLAGSAQRRPDHVAVVEPGLDSITYRELDRLSDRLRDRLVALGVGSGQRVGLWIPKTIDSVAAILGILKAGAAYVPVDPTAPAVRNAYIMKDCAVSVLLVEARFESALRAELGPFAAEPKWIVLPESGGGRGLAAALERGTAAPPTRTADPGPDALAYVLYTSGSTGRPKGVMLTHRAATAFVEWSYESFEPRAEDRFSSHAPFHFDLSIFDLYVPQRAGASVVLIGEERGREPVGLAALIADERISIWYSAPSILTMLAQHGKLGSHDYERLRAVLFAGEVFPVAHLRSLATQLPHSRYFNLYGPTETNVCTHHEVPLPIPDERVEPFPIGRVCSNLRGVVVDSAGAPVRRGEEGELCVAGPNLMTGYWNLPEQTQRAFLERDGKRFYRTGDVVLEEPDGNLRFLGRRDRMVKKRGYRVELGEIEACLYRHPEILEAAVVALPDPAAGVRIAAHVATRGGQKLSLIATKRFCSEHLPVYMIPDAVKLHEALPKTSTDKVDYQKLKELS
jgi:amino acid adenylation domain-containing protein